MPAGNSPILKSRPVLNIGWRGMQVHCETISRYLKQVQVKFDIVVAIARGGLVPAACIAQEMQIRDVLTVSVSSYSNDGEPTYPPQFGPYVNDKFLKSLNSYSTILVDDIVDSGATMALLNQYMPLAVKCVVIAKTGSEKMVNFYGAETARDVWVNFPWEK